MPVWVGADRYVAGERAEEQAEGSVRGVHLLDDGFQHRQLARNVDIVLVTAEDLEDTLLPAGNLREGSGCAAARGCAGGAARMRLTRISMQESRR